MRIYVNGKETDVEEQITVARLLENKGLNPSAVVVERNLEILPKEQLSERLLVADDKLEIITFVGGG